jgi:hypothetical protein
MCPSCSQNAHDKNVLVRCAQERAALATPLKNGKQNWKAALNARSRDSFKPFWNNTLESLAAALPAERCVLARRG